MTLPSGWIGCQLENEVRKMLDEHIGPVMSSAPAFGISSRVPVSLAILAMPSATPEWTVPTSTSTLSRCTSRLVFSGALAGLDSSSTAKYSISRPPSLPPRSPTAMRKPLVIAVPSEAKVPVAGSIMPTLILAGWAWTKGADRAAPAATPPDSEMNRRRLTGLSVGLGVWLIMSPVIGVGARAC